MSKSPKIYAFINRKGGSAKTTSAVNVASRIAQLIDGRVLIIDLDPQGHAAAALGIKPNGRCISDLLIGDKTLRDVMIPADRSDGGGPSRPNLFIIPSSDRLKDATTELLAKDFAAAMSSRRGSDRSPQINTIISRRLNPYLHHFEYVIVDCPPSLGALDAATYDFVREVIVPVKMAYLDTAGAKQHLDDIQIAQESGARVHIKYVLPTFFRANEILARRTFNQLRKLYGRSVAVPIPQSVIVEKSQAAGQRTLFEYDPESAPAKSYEWLVQRIMNNG